MDWDVFSFFFKEWILEFSLSFSGANLFF